MKIVFMGTPAAAARSLERLIADGHEIAAVYTQPDRPAGRGQKVSVSPVKELAAAAGLSVVQPVKVKTAEAAEQFCSFKADAAVVVAYGRILPAAFLEAFPGGALNVHFSLLPKYRGAAPVNWAIVNNEKVTGVTMMRMDEGLDTGPILMQKSVEIGDNENSIELMDRLAVLGAELLSRSLAEIETIEPRTQNDADASYAPILGKADGRIDWTATAADIRNRVRGFQPFPTAYTFAGERRITIWRANAATAANGASPGTVVESSGRSIAVACGKGTVLEICELQAEGKRRMSAGEFLNGGRLERGTILGAAEGA